MDEMLNNLAEEIYVYQQSHEYWTPELANEPLDDLQVELDELDSYWYVDEFDEKKLRDTFRTTIQLANDIMENHLYEGYIQLSDNHTMYELTADISEEEYNLYVCEAIERFKEQVHTEVYCLGRSGRHICVDNTYENAARFESLCDIQRSFEKDMIKTINELEKTNDEHENLE